MDFIHAWIVPPEATVGAEKYIAAALFVLFVTAISKGGFGGGIGIIAIPLMLQVSRAEFAVGMWLPVLIACDLATVHQYPKEWSGPAVLKLAPGMLLGIAVATFAWWRFKAAGGESNEKLIEAWLKLIVAVTCSAFVILQWRKPSHQEQVGWSPTWPVSLPVGVLAGITTTFAHAAGVIINMYFLSQKLEQRVFVGTCGRFFFFVNTLKVPFMFAIGVMTLHSVRYGLWLMLLAPPCVALGSWLNRRLTATWFVRLIYISLFFSAGKLSYDAFVTLNKI